MPDEKKNCKRVLTKEEEDFETKRNAEINRIMEAYDAEQYKQAQANEISVKELQFSNKAMFGMIQALRHQKKELEELVSALREEIASLKN